MLLTSSMIALLLLGLACLHGSLQAPMNYNARMEPWTRILHNASQGSLPSIQPSTVVDPVERKSLQHVLANYENTHPGAYRQILFRHLRMMNLPMQANDEALAEAVISLRHKEGLRGVKLVQLVEGTNQYVQSERTDATFDYINARWRSFLQSHALEYFGKWNLTPLDLQIFAPSRNLTQPKEPNGPENDSDDDAEDEPLETDSNGQTLQDILATKLNRNNKALYENAVINHPSFESLLDYLDSDVLPAAFVTLVRMQRLKAQALGYFRFRLFQMIKPKIKDPKVNKKIEDAWKRSLNSRSRRNNYKDKTKGKLDNLVSDSGTSHHDTIPQSEDAQNTGKDDALPSSGSLHPYPSQNVQSPNSSSAQYQQSTDHQASSFAQPYYQYDWSNIPTASASAPSQWSNWQDNQQLIDSRQNQQDSHQFTGSQEATGFHPIDPPGWHPGAVNAFNEYNMDLQNSWYFPPPPSISNQAMADHTMSMSASPQRIQFPSPPGRETADMLEGNIFMQSPPHYRDYTLHSPSHIDHSHSVVTRGPYEPTENPADTLFLNDLWGPSYHR